eukprot:RCo019837
MAGLLYKWSLATVVTLLMTVSGLLVRFEKDLQRPLFSGTVLLAFANGTAESTVRGCEEKLQELPVGRHSDVFLRKTDVSAVTLVWEVGSTERNLSDIREFLLFEAPECVKMTSLDVQDLTVHQSRHFDFLLIFFVEALKLIFSGVFHLASGRFRCRCRVRCRCRCRTGDSPKRCSMLRWKPSCGCLSYCIPAALYVVDNNLYLMVVELIGPLRFHLFNAIKIPITAVLFRVFLARKLSANQWCAIVLLFVGVLVAQQSEILRQLPVGPHAGCSAGSSLSSSTAAASGGGLDGFATAPSGAATEVAQALFSSPTVLLGFLLVATMAAASSFANIWSEYLYKKDTSGPGFYGKNAQLYAYGVVFNGLCLIARDWWYTGAIQTEGLFAGWTALTPVIVVITAVYGFGVAHVLNVLDNIANAFTHASALLLTLVVSAAMLSYHPTLLFFCGVAVVVLAMFLYHNTGRTAYAPTLQLSGEMWDPQQRASGGHEEEPDELTLENDPMLTEANDTVAQSRV